VTDITQTTYTKRHIIRWVAGKQRTIAGSAHGLDAAINLARSLAPPPGTQEILITQGRITQWREAVNV
jgi:hypothetical protein